MERALDVRILRSRPRRRGCNRARKFVEFEKANGPYNFGMFAKTLLPRPADWADEYGSTKGYTNWDKHAGAIPKEVTERITSAAFSNYRSDTPFPC